MFNNNLNKSKWTDQSVPLDSDTVAKILHKKVRIFCMIMTLGRLHESRALHVKKTWAHRCNDFIFVSDKADLSLPAINGTIVVDWLSSVDLNATDDRRYLWQKTINAFEYVYDNYGDHYDYFLKADDDTFVIVENLRYMVKSLNASEPFFMGRQFKNYIEQGYMSGGAGYLLSKGALKNLIEKGYRLNKCSPHFKGTEDVNIGNCMHKAGVKIFDSLDYYKRETFHPFMPSTLLFEDSLREESPWIFHYNYHSVKFGTDCCSHNSVSFHFVKPKEMYILEFLIYHVRPYGIVREYAEIKNIIDTSDDWL